MIKINSSVIFVIIILLMGGVIYYYVNENSKYKSEIANKKQNEAALKGEIVVTENKLGEVVKSKAILETEYGELKNYSEDLAVEREKLKGRVDYLSKIIIEYENGPQISESDKVINYGDNIYGVEWEFIKNYTHNNTRIIRGLTKFKYNPIESTIIAMNTELLRDYLHFSVVSGLQTENGITSTFVTTPIPDMNITDMSGWRRRTSPTKKKNRIGVSLYSGYGLTYSPSNSMIYHGLQVGGGLTLSIW